MTTLLFRLMYMNRRNLDKIMGSTTKDRIIFAVYAHFGKTSFVFECHRGIVCFRYFHEQ